MAFFGNHYLLVIFAVFSSFTFYKFLPRVINKYTSSVIINNSLPIKVLSLLVFLAFLVWGYLSKPAYYFPYNIGVDGDNYSFVGSAIEHNWYLLNHHLSFPFLAELFLRVMETMGLISLGDPEYLEKAYLLSSAPVRYGIIFSLLIFFLTFCFRFNFWKGFFSTALLATSYATWMWGIQSNSLGISIMIELLAASSFLYWYQSQKYYSLITFGVLNALGVFAHSAAFHFTLGAGITAVILIIFKNKQNKPGAIKQIFIFGLTNMVMGALFFAVQFKANNANSFHDVFTALQSGLNPHPGILSGAFGNITRGIMNFTNHWDPKNTFDILIIFFQLTSFITLIILALSNLKKNKIIENIEGITFGIVTSFSVFMGFMIVNPSTHYYCVALVPNALLFLFLLYFKTDSTSKRSLAHTTLLLFIISSFLYSGFSSKKVLKGLNINEKIYAHSYYFTTNSLYKLLNNNKFL